MAGDQHIVTPNYTYAGPPTRTVRKDSMFESPQLMLGGPRMQNKWRSPEKGVPSSQTRDIRRYGRHGEGTGEHLFFQNQPMPDPGPYGPTRGGGGNSGVPITDDDASGGRGTPGAPGNDTGDTITVQTPGGPIQIPASVMNMTRYAPPQIKRQPQPQQASAPLTTPTDQGGGFLASAMPGIQQFAGAVGGLKESAGDAMGMASKGINPGEPMTGFQSGLSSMFAGPSQDEIDNAYKINSQRFGTVPGAETRNTAMGPGRGGMRLSGPVSPHRTGMFSI